MLKTIKRILLGSFSVLGISLLVWTIALLNPGLSYAYATKIDQVTVFHNQELAAESAAIIHQALAIISESDLFNSDIEIQLCLNDGSGFPEYHPLSTGLAYSFLNKSVLYACQPDFAENIASAQWEVNNNELRKFDLTWLIAHEFMHCLQSNENVWLQFNIGFWKLEGHAEYISREWKNDHSLKQKLERFLEEEKLKHSGLPVITLKDGTRQILPYYKYGLLTQFLMEEEGMNFEEFINDERSIDQIYLDLLAWNQKS